MDADARLSIEYELADVPRCLRPAAAPTLFSSPNTLGNNILGQVGTASHSANATRRPSQLGRTRLALATGPLLLRHFQGYERTS